MKKVLVVYYTQTGQLREIAQSVVRPLLQSGNVEVTFHEILPVTPFPFPWPRDAFFGVFPETFLQTPVPLHPIPPKVLGQRYDLVLFFYQTWYLSPSIPANSFLQSAEGRCILKETRVVTINGSRNMWIIAQEKVKTMLKDAGARLVGNIALVDQAGNLISVITIVGWMFSGIKKKHWGVLPLPGVSQKDVEGASGFGAMILAALMAGNYDLLQPQIVEGGGVRIKPFLVLTDRTGNKLFAKWARLIVGHPNSRPMLLKLFNIYLFLAIWLISPIVYILHVITLPLKIKQISRDRNYFQGVA